MTAQIETEADRGIFIGDAVPVAIRGRMLCASNVECDCLFSAMTNDRAIASVDIHLSPGERVVAYLEKFGRVEGVVEKRIGDEYLIDLKISKRSQEKFSQQLDRISKPIELRGPEDRLHKRLTPRRPDCELTLDDGRQYGCQLIDISRSGAAVEINFRPAFGTALTLGKMRGRVVRHFQEGFAIEFLAIQPKEALKPFF